MTENTIVGWSVQWKLSVLLLPTVRVLLVAPAAISPESRLPSLATMWWSVPSLFLKAIVCPTVTAAGLGENAPEPELPTMLTVTFAPLVPPPLVVPPDGDGVGVVGYPLPPPPHAAAENTMRTKTKNLDRFMPVSKAIMVPERSQNCRAKQAEIATSEPLVRRSLYKEGNCIRCA